MLADLRSGTLTLDAATVLIVDEAGMVGTPALRELLDAAGVAGTRPFWSGSASAGPGQSSGGMFAQLAADLPWAQQLSQVWRMRDRGAGRVAGGARRRRHRAGGGVPSGIASISGCTPAIRSPWPPTRWRRGPRMVRAGSTVC
jgi:hypothetical protein